MSSAFRSGRSLPNGCGYPDDLLVAECQFNDEAGTLEIAVRVFGLHLEESLSHQTGRPVDLDEDGLDGDLERWVRAGFELRADGERLPLTWVGSEHDGPDTWIYVECSIPPGCGELEVRNLLLIGELDGQINAVTFVFDNRRETLWFGEHEAAWQPIPTASSTPVDVESAVWKLARRAARVLGPATQLAAKGAARALTRQPLPNDDGHVR